MDLTADLEDDTVPWSHEEQSVVHGQLDLLGRVTDYELSLLLDVQQYGKVMQHIAWSWSGFSLH